MYMYTIKIDEYFMLYYVYTMYIRIKRVIFCNSILWHREN